MTFRFGLLLSTLAIPGFASAQDWDTDPYDPDLGALEEAADDSVPLVPYNEDPHLVTGIGTAVMVGGGTMNRVASGAQDNATNTGGSWLARAVVGTRSVVAGEASYIGSAAPIEDNVQGFENDAVLVSNGAEANLRVQAPIGAGMNDGAVIAPFATAGLALNAYDVTNSNNDLTSDGDFGDDITWHLPVGGGIAFMTSGFIADARITYRPTIGDTQNVFEQQTPFDNALDAIAVTGSIGIEF